MAVESLETESPCVSMPHLTTRKPLVAHVFLPAHQQFQCIKRNKPYIIIVLISYNMESEISSFEEKICSVPQQVSVPESFKFCMSSVML